MVSVPETGWVSKNGGVTDLDRRMILKTDSNLEDQNEKV